VAALPALAAPQAAPLDVVVSEIAWMGTTASSNDEWIELYNTTGGPVDLTGWTLSAADSNPSIILNGTIPAGGHFLLERTDDDTVPGVPADQIYTGALGNDGEDLVLRDGASNIVDHVDCSAGWFSGHSDGRVPMVRVSTTASGSLTSTWTYNPRCGTATNSMGISHTCVLTVTDDGRRARTRLLGVLQRACHHGDDRHHRPHADGGRTARPHRRRDDQRRRGPLRPEPAERRGRPDRCPKG
jgi:hypothetical protein